MDNIDFNNPDSITVFSPEAHLIFRSSSLSLMPQGQYQHQELKNKMDMKKQLLSTEVDNSDE